MTPDRLDIVLCSLESWDDVWRRNQLLVAEIIRARPSTRVLFVEPAADLLHSARRTELPRQLGLRKVHPHVWAFRPYKVWPRAVAGLNVDIALGERVLRAARRIGMDDHVLWVNDTSYAIMAATSNGPVIYDITDDWLQASGTPRSVLRRRLEHAAMLGTAHRVSVVSESLARDAGRARSVARIPDAVDLEHFQRSQPRPDDLPAGDYVTYIGTLHSERIDVDLCADIAQHIAPASFVLVGPDALEDRHRRHLTDAGCIILGARPYSRVPAYYQHAGVIAVPHVVTPFTESLDPIKLYECLAVGRPTISTAVSGMRDAGPPIEIASRDTFAVRTRELLMSRLPSNPRTAPTWADRAADMLKLIDEARESTRST